MTETNTTLTEAIAKCDEIKARLETLREMSEPKTVLRLESIAKPGEWWEPRNAGELAECAPGTVIYVSGSISYFRFSNSCHRPWAYSTGHFASHDIMWSILTDAASNGIALTYSTGH